MISKCLSCGYLHHEIELNCSNCDSFYTEIVDDRLPPKSAKQKKLNIIEKVKHQLKLIIPDGVRYD